MCRNIKTLANFTPAATDDEIRASALQFVRKLSGMNRPSRANETAFNRAVDEVTDAAHRLIHSLATGAGLAPQNEPPTLRRELGKWDLTAIGVNQVIGSAIFLLPSQVAAQVGNWSPF